MSRPGRLFALASSALVVLVLSCGKREGACKDFDACEDSAGCPAVRCVCDDFPATYAPTCGHDGTCFTTLDCAELCTLAGSTCSKPPATCDQFIPTACSCSQTGHERFAAAWICSDGSQDDVSAFDCDQACHVTSGQGGSGSTGVTSGTSM
jgi:hypothetical protein